MGEFDPADATDSQPLTLAQTVQSVRNEVCRISETANKAHTQATQRLGQLALVQTNHGEGIRSILHGVTGVAATLQAVVTLLGAHAPAAFCDENGLPASIVEMLTRLYHCTKLAHVQQMRAVGQMLQQLTSRGEAFGVQLQLALTHMGALEVASAEGLQPPTLAQKMQVVADTVRQLLGAAQQSHAQGAQQFGLLTNHGTAIQSMLHGVQAVLALVGAHAPAAVGAGKAPMPATVLEMLDRIYERVRVVVESLVAAKASQAQEVQQLGERVKLISDRMGGLQSNDTPPEPVSLAQLLVSTKQAVLNVSDMVWQVVERIKADEDATRSLGQMLEQSYQRALTAQQERHQAEMDAAISRLGLEHEKALAAQAKSAAASAEHERNKSEAAHEQELSELRDARDQAQGESRELAHKLALETAAKNQWRAQADSQQLLFQNLLQGANASFTSAHAASAEAFRVAASAERNHHQVELGRCRALHEQELATQHDLVRRLEAIANAEVVNAPDIHSMVRIRAFRVAVFD